MSSRNPNPNSAAVSQTDRWFVVPAVTLGEGNRRRIGPKYSDDPGVDGVSCEEFSPSEVAEDYPALVDANPGVETWYLARLFVLEGDETVLDDIAAQGDTEAVQDRGNAAGLLNRRYPDRPEQSAAEWEGVFFVRHR